MGFLEAQRLIPQELLHIIVTRAGKTRKAFQHVLPPEPFYQFMESL